MKYLIVCLIKDEAKEFQEDLLYRIARQFKLTGAIKRKPPAHITLKYAFETEKIEEVENIMASFCKNQYKTPFKLEGFDFFKRSEIRKIVVNHKHHEGHQKCKTHLSHSILNFGA